ncbi:hypothetical protein VPNG_01241 [Cytospora leucostoma]|uniref:Transcription initiation factor TFIID subunit 13 n=1 Tax=Cytospora leucostoma TaxID=1230097 RepID=A0A423XL98_9PEZI|nr:hypothetical protein VPNG_01241 [Cytospora leucostoma]
MEPRARAGKNVGKMNFSYQEPLATITVTQFLIAHGDSRQPLPDTIRVLDEILTEFIQGVSFEATRVAQLAGRQKVKYEDFQFAMRKNPVFLGKAAENKELREIIDKQRRVFNEDEMIKEDVGGAGAGGASSAAGGRGRKRAAAGAGGAAGSEGGGANGSGQDGAPRGAGVDVDEEELGEMDDVDDAELVGAGNRRA